MGLAGAGCLAGSWNAKRAVCLTICNTVVLVLSVMHANAQSAGGPIASVSVPVPAVAIYPGKPIENGQLTDKPVRPSIAQAAVHQSRVTVIGKAARRVLMPGKPIPVAALKEVEIVSAGQPVALIYAFDGIEIAGRAIPLQSGKSGETVSVRNLDSGVVVQGRVEADGTVRVDRK
jgi:flagellar basal body P-ring formation protein FlgA